MDCFVANQTDSLATRNDVEPEKQWRRTREKKWRRAKKEMTSSQRQQ